MIAVYDDRPEERTFQLLFEASRELECEPNGLLEVSPRDLEFDFLSDVGSMRQRLQVGSDRLADLVAGADPVSRVVKAGLTHRKLGRMIVEYLPRRGGDRHPIAVSMSAATLGLPDSLWAKKDRSAAKRIADWSREALELASSKCDPLYGGIAVEMTLPSPSSLSTTQSKVPSELFVSRRLTDRDQSLVDRLRQVFADGEVTNWRNGLFCAGWAPYVSGGQGITDLADTRGRASKLVKQAVSAGR